MEIFLVYRGIFRRDEEEISIAVSFLDRLHALGNYSLSNDEERGWKFQVETLTLNGKENFRYVVRRVSWNFSPRDGKRVSVAICFLLHQLHAIARRKLLPTAKRWKFQVKSVTLKILRYPTWNFSPRREGNIRSCSFFFSFFLFFFFFFVDYTWERVGNYSLSNDGERRASTPPSSTPPSLSMY